MPRGETEAATPDSADRVLVDLVRDLARELHPQRRAVAVDLTSELDGDLGFDSLSRAELIVRIDRTFSVSCPETVIFEAETVQDLLEAIRVAAPAGAVTVTKAAELPRQGAREPVAATTLIEVLEIRARDHPERAHVILQIPGGGEQVITYGALHDAARHIAGGLRARGLEPGGRVAIMLPTSAAFFEAFFGILFAGMVPVPVYPPARPSQIEEHLLRQVGILRNAQACLMITDERMQSLSGVIGGLVDTLTGVTTIARLTVAAPVPEPAPAKAGNMALIQYTSGSTGDPKGVVLSHANLLANIRAMGARAEVTSRDVFVSWLPLYHDMGLIGAWLGSLYYGMVAVILSPVSFLAAPANWLKLIDRYRATLSASPNFGYELCLKHVRDEDIAGIDLSSLRMVVNGAEPVAPGTIRRFTERFSPYGFRPEALAPVYGLAESAVGLAFPVPGRMPVIDRIERAAMAGLGDARPAAPGDETALEFPACGQPLPGHEVRIVDDAGRELPDRRQGRLEFRGPSATSGYYRNMEKTRSLIRDGWLDSGDLAYAAGGDIYITGRIKDLIIRAGRNIYPHELEDHVGALDGIRTGCVAVFPTQDTHGGTEQLVVVAETRETDQQTLEDLRARVADAALALLDLPPDDIVLVPPRTIPKTSSGKIRRAATRALYETRALGPRTRALWRQMANLWLAARLRTLTRRIAGVFSFAFALYWWALLVLVAAVVWPLVLVLPKRSWRHGIVHTLANAFLFLTGITLSVDAEGSSPTDAAILVVNHTSYLDGLVLCAAFPGHLAFVAKHELASQRVAGPFLRRLGALFVRRDDTKGGLEDMETALSAARDGERLVWFPEGTLTRRPGLMAFLLGPFTVAAQAELPIVPVALSGTRSILRGEQWFPRHGHITISVGAPIEPAGSDFADALSLRNRARAFILDHCGEPDLAEDDSEGLFNSNSSQKSPISDRPSSR